MTSLERSVIAMKVVNLATASTPASALASAFHLDQERAIRTELGG